MINIKDGTEVTSLKELKISRKMSELKELVAIMNYNNFTINEMLKDIDKNNRWEKYKSLNKIMITYKENGDARGTLQKQITKYGFYYNARFKKWFNKNSQNIKSNEEPKGLTLRKLFSGMDIEERIEGIADKRYYNSFTEGFYFDSKTKNVNIEMNENIYLEYAELSKIHGCDSKEEFMMFILLEYLDKQVPKDYSKEFSLRSLRENIGENEYQFVIKYMELGYDWESLIPYAYETEDLTIEGFLKAMEELSEEEL